MSAIQEENYVDYDALRKEQRIVDHIDREALASEPPKEVFEHEGFLVDSDGTIYDVVTPRKQFEVKTIADAEWVLQKLGEYEAKIAAVDATDAVIHARSVIANAEALKKPLQKRREYLEQRFKAQCQVVAGVELKGKKERTLKTLFGAISLRTVRGKLTLKKDQELLGKWAHRFCKEAEKITVEVQIGLVPVALKKSVELKLRFDRVRDLLRDTKAEVERWEASPLEEKEEQLAQARLRLAELELQSLTLEKDLAHLAKDDPKLLKVATDAETLGVFELPDDREECDLKTGVAKVAAAQESERGS